MGNSKKQFDASALSADSLERKFAVDAVKPLRQIGAFEAECLNMTKSAAEVAAELFGDIPAIAAEIRRLTGAALRESPQAVAGEINDGVHCAVTDYFFEKSGKAGLSLAQELIGPDDIKVLLYLRERFLQRKDIQKLSAEVSNYNRGFPFKLNGQQYICTLVSDSEGTANTQISFMPNRSGDVRRTHILQLSASGRSGKEESGKEKILSQISDEALNLISNLNKLLSFAGRNNALRSLGPKEKEKLAIQLLLGLQIDGRTEPGIASAVADVCDYRGQYSSRLSAVDYAEYMEKDKRKLVDILIDPPTALIYVIRGIFELFHDVMDEAVYGDPYSI